MYQKSYKFVLLVYTSENFDIHDVPQFMAKVGYWIFYDSILIKISE